MKVKGVSPDTDIEVNKNGAIQSKTEYAVHLLDVQFLQDYCTDGFLKNIAKFMKLDSKAVLLDTIRLLAELSNISEHQVLLKIAEVRHYGTYVRNYPANNWKDISQESHLNHAIIHYLAYKSGDTQDDHLGHCLCRLMFVYSTKCSEGYSYT